MVKIVTGKINSLKTTRMLEHYQKEQKGDGFIAKKIMQHRQVHSYNLIQLSNKKEMPLIIRDIYDDELKEIIYKLGPYHFYKDAFDYIEYMVDEFIVNKISPIYLDEISILELDNKGYHHVLTKLLDNNVDLVLVIRSDILTDVLKKYNIKEFKII
ncbi:MAG: nucleoside-triphosphatase [Candidatus Izemoplasmatales bacterium]